MEGPITQRAMIKVNGLNLFYRDTGSNNQPMLCLHGRWGRGETWSELMFQYRDRYRIIAPDQRGHGLSDKPIARYSSKGLAADAYGLIQHLDCEPVIVVGHSMGGRIAAFLTALYPQAFKALVILDEGADGPENLSKKQPEDVPAEDILTSSWPTPYSTYEEAIQDLSGRFERETNVRYFLDSLVETVKGYDYLFSRYSMSAIDEYNQEWHHILPKIQCPVLLVRAVDSWCLSEEEADRMKTMIRDCTYFEVTDSDHMVYADNPAEFYPQFDLFLKRIQAG